LILRAGGVLRSGPEKTLVDDYMTRAQSLARGTGFLSVEDQALDLKGQYDRAAETSKLLSWMSTGKVQHLATLQRIFRVFAMTTLGSPILLSAAQTGSIQPP